MTQTKESLFKQKELVHAVTARENEELRFSIVEVDGRICADIRFFSEWAEVKKLTPTQRGIMVDPAKLNDVAVGVAKLAEYFKKRTVKKAS